MPKIKRSMNGIGMESRENSVSGKEVVLPYRCFGANQESRIKAHW
jgi:hypothetical protein